MFLEQILSDVTGYLMTPVLLLLAAMFCYSLLALGMFLFDVIARLRRRRSTSSVARLAALHDSTQNQLELQLLRELENPRIVSRVAPMLGLVATMIPMGPALMAVSSGDSAGMAEQLTVAFAAVIVALVSASICYVIVLVRRRWLLAEISMWLAGRQSELTRGDAAV